MYINFSLKSEKGISDKDLIALLYLFQNKSKECEYDLENLNNLGYISYLKDDSPRLSGEGKKVLTSLTTPNLTENHIKLAAYLIEKYKTDGDKILCSQKKLESLIAWFCSETGLEARELYSVLLAYWESDDSKFNKKLEYLFFKPETFYSKRSLQHSRLYDWMVNNFKK